MAVTRAKQDALADDQVENSISVEIGDGDVPDEDSFDVKRSLEGATTASEVNRDETLGGGNSEVHDAVVVEVTDEQSIEDANGSQRRGRILEEKRRPKPSVAVAGKNLEGTLVSDCRDVDLSVAVEIRRSEEVRVNAHRRIDAASDSTSAVTEENRDASFVRVVEAPVSRDDKVQVPVSVHVGRQERVGIAGHWIDRERIQASRAGAQKNRDAAWSVEEVASSIEERDVWDAVSVEVRGGENNIGVKAAKG